MCITEPGQQIITEAQLLGLYEVIKYLSLERGIYV